MTFQGKKRQNYREGEQPSGQQRFLRGDVTEKGNTRELWRDSDRMVLHLDCFGANTLYAFVKTQRTDYHKE